MSFADRLSAALRSAFKPAPIRPPAWRRLPATPPALDTPLETCRRELGWAAVLRSAALSARAGASSMLSFWKGPAMLANLIAAGAPPDPGGEPSAGERDALDTLAMSYAAAYLPACVLLLAPGFLIFALADLVSTGRASAEKAMDNYALACCLALALAAFALSPALVPLCCCATTFWALGRRRAAIRKALAEQRRAHAALLALGTPAFSDSGLPVSPAVELRCPWDSIDPDTALQWMRRGLCDPAEALRILSCAAPANGSPCQGLAALGRSCLAAFESPGSKEFCPSSAEARFLEHCAWPAGSAWGALRLGSPACPEQVFCAALSVAEADPAALAQSAFESARLDPCGYEQLCAGAERARKCGFERCACSLFSAAEKRALHAAASPAEQAARKPPGL